MVVSVMPINPQAEIQRGTSRGSGYAIVDESANAPTDQHDAIIVSSRLKALYISRTDDMEVGDVQRASVADRRLKG